MGVQSPFLTPPDKPSLSLYGQHQEIDDFEFAHIETIADRAGKHGWMIEPHRHAHLFQLILLLDGRVSITLDSDKRELAGPCVILVPPLTIHGFAMDEDTKGYVLTVADTYLRNLMPARWKHHCGTLIDTPSIVDLHDQAHTQRLQNNLLAIGHEHKERQFGRAIVVEANIRIIFAELGRCLEERQQVVGVHDAQVSAYYRFRTLVDEHYKDHWTLQQYADRLSVTEKQINEICKKMVNRTAYKLVQERQITEARRLLTYTLSTVEQISYKLGFQDPAYFSRFFKKQVGLPPGQYRTDMAAKMSKATDINYIIAGK